MSKNIDQSNETTAILNKENEDSHFDNADVLPESNAVPKNISQLELEYQQVAPKKQKKTEKNFGYYCRQSVILYVIISVISFFGKLIRNSFTVSVFTSYNRSKEAFSSSKFASCKLVSALKIFTYNAKRGIQHTTSNALLPKFFASFTSKCMAVNTRIYGLMLLFFGTGTTLIYLLNYYYLKYGNHDNYAILTSCILILASLFLLFNNNTLGHTLRESKLGSIILFNVLGIKPPKNDPEFHLSGSGACILGTLLSFLTFFIPAHLILLASFIIIYTLIVIKSPETGFLSLFLLAPFVSEMTLVLICSITTVSYLCKAACGKRTLKFEFLDALIFVFAIILLLGGLITFGDINRFYIPIIYTVVYFIAVSILRNSIWFKRTLNIIIISGVILTIYAAFLSAFNGITTLSIDYTPQTDVGLASATIFTSLSLIGVFIISVLYYALSQFFISNQPSKKLIMLTISLLAAFFIFSSLSIFTKIAVIISLTLFLILYNNKFALLVVLTLLMIPFLDVFISDPYTKFIGLFANEEYRLNIWNHTLHMLFSDNLPNNAALADSFLSKFALTGIGIGNGAFSEIFSSVYPLNDMSITHSYSLFIQIFVSLGAVGLITFILIIFYLLQNCFSFGRNCADKKNPARIYNYAGMCSLLTLIICGLTEFICYNNRVILIFWLMFAITVSAKRSIDDEHEAVWELGELREYYDIS